MRLDLLRLMAIALPSLGVVLGSIELGVAWILLATVGLLELCAIARNDQEGLA